MSYILVLIGLLLFICSSLLLAVTFSAWIINKLGKHSNLNLDWVHKIKSYKFKGYKLFSFKNNLKLFAASFILMISGGVMMPEDTADSEDADVASVSDVNADEPKNSQEEQEAEQKEQEEKDKQERIEREKQKAAEAEAKKKEEEAKKKEEELTEKNPNKSEQFTAPNSAPSVPSGETYVVVNDNVPYFNNEDISSTDVYHDNGAYDSLGRVTVANAVVGVEIMPAEERGDIGHIEPTGWNQARYAGIDSGGWLYNRSHLIGHQMTGNDDPQNIMTGTRSFNMAMLEFENFIANYVETTENHVRYRVTPVFEGDNLVASGVYMEGFSIEDNGEEIQFNIYVVNRQPNVEINYANGSSIGPAESSETSGGSETEPEPDPEPEQSAPVEDVSSVDANGNGKVTIQEAKDAGFSMPINSNHWLYQYMDDRDGDGTVGE